ncbi:hypothetical protein KPH14_006818 [Odynerus spinipes]|uniref:Uncharacterized protein n=1 Tax=Odynerus spinipes TaxID=1348599 RepID=A0AAD9RSA8_9HYME|nr:hypothetical protein KPH14_006818 [Odynerus spinipes]
MHGTTVTIDSSSTYYLIELNVTTAVVVDAVQSQHDVLAAVAAAAAVSWIGNIHGASFSKLRQQPFNAVQIASSGVRRYTLIDNFHLALFTRWTGRSNDEQRYQPFNEEGFVPA